MVVFGGIGVFAQPRSIVLNSNEIFATAQDAPAYFKDIPVGKNHFLFWSIFISATPADLSYKAWLYTEIGIEALLLISDEKKFAIIAFQNNLRKLIVIKYLDLMCIIVCGTITKSPS